MLDWQELEVPKDKGVANNKKLLSLALSYTGMWLSWLERLTGSQEVGGSNPLFSTSVTATLYIRKAHH